MQPCSSVNFNRTDVRRGHENDAALFKMKKIIAVVDRAPNHSQNIVLPVQRWALGWRMHFAALLAREVLSLPGPFFAASFERGLGLRTVTSFNRVCLSVGPSVSPPPFVLSPSSESCSRPTHEKPRKVVGSDV